MKFCTRCGKELVDDAIVCTGCGCSVTNKNSGVDQINVWLCVLAFFIPLFGFIYWPVKHKETPIKARACGITAIISWVLGVILNLSILL